MGLDGGCSEMASEKADLQWRVVPNSFLSKCEERLHPFRLEGRGFSFCVIHGKPFSEKAAVCPPVAFLLFLSLFFFFCNKRMAKQL
jgi:hypothetical protein